MRCIWNFDETTVLHHQGIYNYFFSEQNLFHRIGSKYVTDWIYLSMLFAFRWNINLFFSLYSCDDKEDCSLSADDFDLGPNPCPDTERYLEAHYICIQTALARPPGAVLFNNKCQASWKVLLFITKLWDHSWINFTPWR